MRPEVPGLWLIEDGAEPRLLLGGTHFPVGWSPDADRVYVFESETRLVRAVDIVTGEVEIVRELPVGAREVDLDVTRDGLGIIAAIAEAPGDAVIVDLRVFR